MKRGVRSAVLFSCGALGLLAASAGGASEPGRQRLSEQALVWVGEEEPETLEQRLLSLGLRVEQRLPRALVVSGRAEELAALESAGLVVQRLESPELLSRRDSGSRELDQVTGHEMLPWLVSTSGVWTAERTEALKELGVRLVGPLPPASWLVRARAEQVARIQRLPWVLEVAPQPVESRISPLFRQLPEEAAGATVRVKIWLDPEAEPLPVLDFLARNAKGFNLPPGVEPWMVGADLSVDLLDELGAFPALAYIEPESRGQLFNNSIRVVMQTERQQLQANQDFYNPIYGLGVFGEGQLVALADSGIELGHEQFAAGAAKVDGPHLVNGTLLNGSACQPDGLDPFSHGTPVANTLAGDSRNSAGVFGTVNGRDGVALKARLYVQDITYDPAGGEDPALCEYTSVPQQILNPAYAAGARVHNHSWGHMSGTGFTSGFYTMETRDLDDWIYQHPDSVQVFAVGNTGGKWKWDFTQHYWYIEPLAATLSDQAHAKNVISVGGSRDADNRHHLYLFSSRGPTANEVQGPACYEQGRIKPDLVAPASTTIESAEVSNPSAYCPISICPYGYFGTSHAAPAISAAAALVRDYFAQPKYPNDARHPQLADPDNPSAALIKAMLVNSAVFLKDPSAYAASKLPPMNCGDTTYPNFDQGYGRPALDTVLEPAGYRQLKAYEDITDVLTTTDPVKATQVGPGQWWTVTPKFKNLWPSSCNVLRVTLAWTDPPPVLPAPKALVNDLDLEVSYQGVTYRGNHRLTGDLGGSTAIWDRLNNVEDVFVPLGQATTTWAQPVVKVYGHVVPVAPQRFAVVATYGPCFDNTPCPTQPVGGCYRGPGDTVPGVHPPPVDGGLCQSQDYSYSDCQNCGQQPWPSCSPPPLVLPPQCLPGPGGLVGRLQCQEP